MGSGGSPLPALARFGQWLTPKRKSPRGKPGGLEGLRDCLG
jgi:hypothetical protein